MSLKLLKSTAIVSAMTLLSRISGLVRDMALAQYLGGGPGADAFFVAFRIPNFLRRIFGEGAFSAAFVPVLSEVQSNAAAPTAKRFVDVLFGRFAAVLLGVTIVGVLAAPWIVTVLAPGFRLHDPERYVLTVQALRIVFPYLFFICLVAMAAGILNARNRFAVPAATPVLLNVCLIAALMFLTPYLPNPTLSLAVGVFIAGAMQLLFQIPFLHREGMLPTPRLRAVDEDKDRVEEANKRVFRLMLPAIFGTSVAQVNMLINTVLASYLVTGSVSWLYYSDRLMEFPLGIFGIALATAILPSLSKLHATHQHQAFNETIDWALRWVALIAMPATVGLIVLAAPIIATIFHHGAFTDRDVHMTSISLIAYSAGLLAFVAVKVLAPGFYARENTKTPVKIAAASMAVNIVLSLLLFYPFGHVGLATATSAAAVANAGALLFLLLRERVYTPLPGWRGFLMRVSAATLTLVIILVVCKGDDAMWLTLGTAERLMRLTWVMGAGVIGYFSVILAVGIRPAALVPRKLAE